MHPDTLKMYLNVVRTVLTKENWKKYKQLYGNDPEMALYFVKLYHKLDRDREKFNKAFEMLLNDPEIKELSETIDKNIELHKKSIEKLKKLKMPLIIKLIEKKLTR